MGIPTEAYKDIISPTAKEIGYVGGRSAKVLLSPLRSLLWGWEKIEELVIKYIEERLKNIPEEKRKTPEPEIAIPLLQALTYTAQNETLRDMYLNLLANSMDKDKDKYTHPSFVEIIKKMNTLDAKVFEKIKGEKGYIKIINPRIIIKGTDQFFPEYLPEWYLGWKIEQYDEFEISASLVRLDAFGLIELMFDRTAGSEGYTEKTDFLEKKLELYKLQIPQFELEIKNTKSILKINEYGKQFINACLD